MKERIPWIVGVLATLFVLLAAWIRPTPVAPEKVALEMMGRMSQALVGALPGDRFQRLVEIEDRIVATDADLAERQEYRALREELKELVPPRLPANVRFYLVRYRRETNRVDELLQVPQGGGIQTSSQSATHLERSVFTGAAPISEQVDRYLVAFVPLDAARGIWIRLSLPMETVLAGEGDDALGWLLVGLLAVLAGSAVGTATGMLRERQDVIRLLAEEEPQSHPDEAIGRLEELGELGGQVAALLTEISRRRSELALRHGELCGNSDQLFESIERVYQVSHEQSGNASSQAAAIQQVSTTAEEMAATARQISDNAARVTALAEETAQACEKGHGSVQDAIRGMEEVRRQVEAIAKRMTVLGANSSKIGGVTAIIDEISKQTNLLALNAAIEAAGAGEAGKRFGVVAVEVKRLADKTGNATKLIKELIHAIQEDTESTVRETELGTDSAMAGAELVKVVGDALELIAERVEQTTASAREIRVSTGQQTHAASQMAGSLGQITDASKAIEEGTHRAVGALVDLRELSRTIQEMVNEMDVP